MKEALLYYKDFRLNKLNTPEYQHLKWLIFWPLYGLMFYFVEHIFSPVKWHVIECSLDDSIPFNEYFFIPYIFWFVFVFGSVIYTMLFDIKAFKRLMKFIAITYSTAIIIFIAYPSCQLLRPFSMPDRNILTHLISVFYSCDTNTNVFPSVHVIGSIAVMYGLWNARYLNRWFFRIPITVMTVLISISTVFMKQHSLLDVACAVLVCLTVYVIVSVLEKNAVTIRRKAVKKRYIN